MVDDGLTLYLREMGQHPVLSKAEERLLFEQLAAGDERAREKIILSNLRLVVHIAKSYDRNGWLDLSDIIQEGNVGLIKAVDKFDHTKGHRFSSMDSLIERDAAILQMHFGFEDEPPYTLGAIGQTYGITKQRTKQLEDRALERLRDILISLP